MVSGAGQWLHGFVVPMFRHVHVQDGKSALRGPSAAVHSKHVENGQPCPVGQLHTDGAMQRWIERHLMLPFRGTSGVNGWLSAP